MALGAAPLALSCVRLARRMDDPEAASVRDICAPNIAAWALLCAGALLAHAGLRANERSRARLAHDIYGGADDGLPVWVAAGAGGGAVGAGESAAALEVAQARRLAAGSAAWIDSLSDEDIQALGARVAAGKVPPRALQLRRATSHLYRRLPEGDATPLPDAPPRGTPAKPPPPGADAADEDALCFICCDRPHGAVLLDCGHGGLCGVCAQRVWLRPPSECPCCRCRVDQVVIIDAPCGRPAPGDGGVVRVRGLADGAALPKVAPMALPMSMPLPAPLAAALAAPRVAGLTRRGALLAAIAAATARAAQYESLAGEEEADDVEARAGAGTGFTPLVAGGGAGGGGRRALMTPTPAGRLRL